MTDSRAADAAMRTGPALARTAAFGLLFLAATWVGRMTVIAGLDLSMVWPAAGVAVAWFCAQRRSPVRGADIAVLAVVTVAVNVATGAGVVLALGFAAANLAQVAVFLHLLGRLAPHLWGGGGTAGLRKPRDLWMLLAATLGGTATGAAVGSTVGSLLAGHWAWQSTVVWLVRNTASVLVLGAAAICLGHALSVRGRRWQWWREATAALTRTPRWRSAESAAVVLCAAATYALGFAYVTTPPLTFPFVAVSAWAAVRLPTWCVVWHSVAVGGVAVVATLAGRGPFAGIAGDATRALVCQLFVAVIATVTLALALTRDERDALHAQAATQRRTAVRRARLLSAVIDSMADGLAVVAADGRVERQNPAADRLFAGIARAGDDLSGGLAGVFRLDGTPVAPHELAYTRALADERVDAEEVVVRHAGLPEGRTIRVTATAVTDPDGGRRAVVLFHDVTAERRHRDDLANFAAIVSHDLLNPLATVEGWTEDARLQLADDRDPRAGGVRDSLDRVQRATARMRGLITGLLAYATARDAAVAPTPLDLGSMVREVAAGRADAAAAAGAPAPQVTVDRLDPVRADPLLARQLLDNLIANAVKYTAPGVTPRITVSSARAGDVVRVAVSDNGIGIPAGQHEAIFDYFHRAPGTAGYSGSGLGLAICKRIVERHGGTITAADNPGGGARFTFTLPAGDDQAAAPR